ncbi:MAG TPA: FAD-dependent oxidoreductase, partial [Solirubrobacteraceae bacterium]|nr:FAD-dependent oxidoreductase [Solirubrobacteraceae bacterium]
QAGGRNELVGVVHPTGSLEDLAALSRFLLGWATQVGIPAHEHALFVERLLTLLTSCDERRLEELEHQSWWEFSGAERRSEAYRKFLADGLTRTLVAARAREMSARTGGMVLLQLLFDLARLGGRADRVLDAPTQEAWIAPWVEHLQDRGVELRTGAPVAGLEFDGRRITGVRVGGSGPARITADHYVAALPVEQLRLLLTPEMRQAEPAFARLDRLVTRWMNGIMFYLDRDVPIVHGHAIHIDSAWALTSISQAQFWGGRDLAAQYGDGRVEGILSVDVSEWERPGPRTGKVAAKCSPEEIRAEVWGQLSDHLDDGAAPVLDEANVLAWFLDPAIEFPNPTEATNLEPLLINTAGSWADRPEARTRIPNLVLASDFVRTHTDLATMEGANEAARRAVNAILEASGSPAARCPVWPLEEPAIFKPARALDKLRWRLFRRPAKPPLRVTADGGVEPTGPLAGAMTRVAARLR